MATRVDGSLYYVHSDLLGSTVAVSNDTGQPMGWVQYDPYGEVITSTLPADLTDRLFTSQRFDNSSGLYYYNARYYDPHLGRFIQPDSLVPDPLNPQAWNRFSYCYNNPVTFNDPSGHDPVTLATALILGGAFLIGTGVGGYYAYQQGYGFESWQLYAYAGMGGLAGVVGAATGMWIEAALLPVGATAGQAFLAGAAGGFAAGVVEQSILEVGGAYILGTEVSAERILLVGGIGGVTGGLGGVVSRWVRLRAADATQTIRSEIRPARELAAQRVADTEVHHLIEKRFAGLFGVHPGDLPAIRLGKTFHQQEVTARLFSKLPTNPPHAYTAQDIWKAYVEVYGSGPGGLNRPDWLKAIWPYFERLGVAR